MTFVTKNPQIIQDMPIIQGHDGREAMRARAEHDERLTVDVATLQAHCATYGSTLTDYCRPVGAPRRAMATASTDAMASTGSP